MIQNRTVVKICQHMIDTIRHRHLENRNIYMCSVLMGMYEDRLLTINQHNSFIEILMEHAPLYVKMRVEYCNYQSLRTIGWFPPNDLNSRIEILKTIKKDYEAKIKNNQH